MKTLELNAFSGVRNDVPHERFSPKDLSKAENIELDNSGKPLRRFGHTVLDAEPIHSLWAQEEMCLCVRSGSLHRIFPDMSFVDQGLAISGPRVAYRRVLNDVFLSDGIVTGVVNASEGLHKWGITPPVSFTANMIPGDLRAGVYLLAITFVRGNGLVSGSSPMQSFTLDGTQGIQITLPTSSDPDVTGVDVYISDTNGELLYLIGSYDLSVHATAEITSIPASRNKTLTTMRCGPPPPSTTIAFHKGRLYLADNQYIWYTQPYQFELIHRAMNYIGFTSPVRTISPVSDGIYVGTDDQTVFLRGTDPAQFELKQVADYGTVLGTETEIPGYHFGEKDHPTNPVAIWMSKKGLCAGLDGGQFMNLTGGRFVLPEGVVKGASLLKIRGASPQLVTTLFS